MLGHARIWLTSSVPRSPAPITPTRMRSAAPSTSAGPAASVPASPVATLPIKFRRESINSSVAGLYFVNCVLSARLFEVLVEPLHAQGQHHHPEHRQRQHLRPQHLQPGALQEDAADDLQKVAHR